MGVVLLRDWERRGHAGKRMSPTRPTFFGPTVSQTFRSPKTALLRQSALRAAGAATREDRRGLS
jgi:hypothetical protein